MARWWHEGAFSSVITTQGRVLRVLYPGRPTPSMGPDFRDALLITEEGDFVRGDVEIHIRQSDWQGHGHHQDSRYNRVVLHLFLQPRTDGQNNRNGQDGKNGTWLEKGIQAQEVLLNSAPLTTGGRTIASPVERLRALSPRDLERALDEAGERRFLGKASAMLEHLQNGDAQEELYAGLMEALGFSRNRDPMMLLARRLPIRHLKRLIGPRPDRIALEALLLGAAGLLPHQRDLCLPGLEERRHPSDLKKIWRSMGEPLVVATGMRSRAGLRPQNHRARRLVGASYIIVEYWHSGLMEGPKTTLEKSTPRKMEKGLQVEGTEFWAHHMDFHHPVARAPALVGRSRAREMVINVVLPFFFAWAHLLGDGELRQRALALYRRLPPSQDNAITREMKSLLLGSKVSQPVVNSAGRQQGLIHIYRVLQGQTK